MIFNTENGKYRFKEFVTPRVRENYEQFSRSVIPNSQIHLTLSQENWIMLPFQLGCC